jgi:hypothetical protein
MTRIIQIKEETWIGITQILADSGLNQPITDMELKKNMVDIKKEFLCFTFKQQINY